MMWNWKFWTVSVLVLLYGSEAGLSQLVTVAIILALIVMSIVAPPPTRPPEEILAQLTQESTIPVEYYYVDDSNKGQGTNVYIHT